MVYGFRLTLIRLGVLFTGLKVYFRHDKNPFRAIGFVRALIRERLRIHDNLGEIKAVKTGSRYFWAENMAGWPSASFDRMINNEYMRIFSPSESTLQTIIFSITNTCPLNCIHCYESDTMAASDKLSLDDLRGIMTGIIASGISHIQFSGGEPLNRFDDMLVLAGMCDSSTDLWVNTSGFGLTEQKAAAMAKNGITGVNISLDHWDEEEHNKFRGNRASYRWVMEAIENCRKAGLVTCLSLCPTKEFISEYNLEKYLDLAHDMGAGLIRFMEPRKAGRFADRDVMLGEEHFRVLDKFMSDHNRSRAYRDYPIIQFNGHHQRKIGCLGAGNRFMYIDSDGNFHSCPFCRKPLGSALEKSIEEGAAMARMAGCQAFSPDPIPVLASGS